MNKDEILKANQEAHNLIDRIMTSKAELEMFFIIDEDNYEALRIRSEGVDPFIYRYNGQSAQWIFEYLKGFSYYGASISSEPADKTSDTFDDLQLGNLDYILKNQGGIIKKGEKDNRGRYIVSLKFIKGIIHFIIEPTEENIKYLKDNNFID